MPYSDKFKAGDKYWIQGKFTGRPGDPTWEHAFGGRGAAGDEQLAIP